MIPNVAWRRRQAAHAAEVACRTHVLNPGCLTRDQARRLSDADGPAPAPSPVVDDDISRACERLFQET